MQINVYLMKNHLGELFSLLPHRSPDLLFTSANLTLCGLCLIRTVHLLNSCTFQSVFCFNVPFLLLIVVAVIVVVVVTYCLFFNLVVDVIVVHIPCVTMANSNTLLLIERKIFILEEIRW